MAEQVGGVDVAEGFQPVVTAVESLTDTMAQVVRAMGQAFNVNSGSSAPPVGQVTQATLSQARGGPSLPAGYAPNSSGVWTPGGVDMPTTGQPTATPAPGGSTLAQIGRRSAYAVVGYGQNPNTSSGSPTAGMPSTAGGGSGGGGGGGGGYTAPGGPAAGSPSTGGGGVGPNTQGPGGGSPGGGLARGLIRSSRNVPIIGTAVAALDDGVKEWQSQRQKNAYYQSIEGTDNIHGFGERINESIGDLATGAMFAPGEYSDLYKQVTALGYTDRSDYKTQSRQGAIDFAYDNKSSMGMDASESGDYLAVAARSATSSFSQLSAALRDVSKDAGEAGVNAQMMRSQMMALVDFNLKAGMMGTGAVANARNDATFNASMGRGYAQGVDVRGKYTTGMAYMVAGANGSTYNEYLSALNTDPAKAAGMRAQVAGLMSESVISASMKKWITDEVGKIGGFDVVRQSPELAADLFPDFLAAFPDPPWNVIQGVLEASTGQRFENAEFAWLYLVQFVGGNDSNNQMVKDAEAAKVKDGFSAQHRAQVSADAGTSWLGLGGNSASASAYIDSATRSGKSDPVLESMFKAMSEQDIDQDQTMVRVKTASGWRQMTMTEAVKNFPNELANGQAKFAELGKPYDGKDIGSALGITLDKSNERRAAALAEQQNANNKDLGTAYKTLDEIEKSFQNQKAVTIGLTPEAARLFKVMPDNNEWGVSPGAVGDNGFWPRSTGGQ